MTGPRRVAALAVALLALSPPRPATADRAWTELRTPHFTILSEAGAGEARRVALEFEQFRAFFDRLTAGTIRTGERPLTVFVLRDGPAMRALTPEYWVRDKEGTLTGLFTSGIDRHYVVLRVDASKELAEAAESLGFVSNPYHAVLHEYVHALTLQQNAGLPTWLNEGLAEFYAGARVMKDRVEIGRPHALTILYLRRGTLLSLPDLFAATVESPLYKDPDKVQRFYAQSWALVHLLRIGQRGQRAQQLSDYARRVEAGGDPVDAAKEAFGDLARLQRELQQYLQSSIFGMQTMKGPTPVDKSAWKEREATATEIDVQIGEFHAISGRFTLASLIVDGLLAQPDSAAAHDLAALLAARQDRHADCLREARTAVRLGSARAATRVVAAEALLAGSPTTEELTEMGRLLQQSVAADPNDPVAAWTLANVYVASGRPGRDALTLAERAIELSPVHAGPYISAAAALLAMGRAGDAIRVAEKAVRYTRTPEDRQRARDFVRRLRQAGDAPPGVIARPASTPRSTDDAPAPRATTTSATESPETTAPPASIRWAIRYTTRGADLTSWLATLSDQLQERLELPPELSSATGHVIVAMIVKKDGSVGDIVVKQSTVGDELAKTVAVALAAAELAVAASRLPCTGDGGGVDVLRQREPAGAGTAVRSHTAPRR